MAAFEMPPGHWKFSAWQKRVWNRTRDLFGVRKVFMVAGRGAGKDIGAIRLAIRDAFKLYGLRKAGEDPTPAIRNPLVRVWVLGPSEKGIKQTIKDLEGELRGLAEEWGLEDEELWHHHRRKFMFSIFGEGEIEIEYLLTAINDSLRGPGTDIVIWTEFASEKREEAYKTEINGTVSRAGRLGRMYIYGTPKNPEGVFWNEVKKVCGGKKVLESIRNDMKLSRNGRSLYVHATYEANEFLTEQQLEDIEEEMEDRPNFERERLAIFRRVPKKAERPPYPEELTAKLLVSTPPAARGRTTIIGVDVSRFGDDETTFVMVDYDSGFVFGIDTFPTTSGPEIVSHIMALAKIHGPGQTTFVMDATSHQAFVSDFLPDWVIVDLVKAYEKGKERLVNNSIYLMKTARVWIPNPETFDFESDEQREAFEKLLHQLTVYQRFQDDRGRISFGHPANEHDDLVVGLYQALDPIARDDIDDLEEPPGDFRAVIGL